jgi:hypothetical protein
MHGARAVFSARLAIEIQRQIKRLDGLRVGRARRRNIFYWLSEKNMLL